VYGLQFHLEVTPAMIEGWCPHVDPLLNAARLAALSSVVFGRW
jgi:GMP synthase-like glutamine amidotransferase